MGALLWAGNGLGLVKCLIDSGNLRYGKTHMYLIAGGCVLDGIFFASDFDIGLKEGVGIEDGLCGDNFIIEVRSMS